MSYTLAQPNGFLRFPVLALVHFHELYGHTSLFCHAFLPFVGLHAIAIKVIAGPFFTRPIGMEHVLYESRRWPMSLDELFSTLAEVLDSLQS